MPKSPAKSLAPEIRFLIGGKLIAGEGDPQPVLNPRTGETILKIPEATPKQVDLAIHAAEKAFATWGRTTPGERAGLLLKIADAIDKEAETFGDLECRNTGKPRPVFLADEMPAVSDCFRFYAGAARCLSGPAAGEYMAGYTSMLRRDPVGVVGSIAPWNFPLQMAAWKLAPALAAGNTIVLKASSSPPSPPFTSAASSRISCPPASPTSSPAAAPPPAKPSSPTLWSAWSPLPAASPPAPR